MASIATVVTMGYGSFGSVNLLPTIGYGISQVVEVPGTIEAGWAFSVPVVLLHCEAPTPQEMSYSPPSDRLQFDSPTR